MTYFPRKRDKSLFHCPLTHLYKVIWKVKRQTIQRVPHNSDKEDLCSLCSGVSENLASQPPNSFEGHIPQAPQYYFALDSSFLPQMIWVPSNFSCVAKTP